MTIFAKLRKSGRQQTTVHAAAPPKPDFNERENYRVPVAFYSFIYPSIGGRVRIRSVDLSCGGLAFLSTYPFTTGDLVQVVIPITLEGPLIVRAQILRVHPGASGVSKFACRFVGLISDEEAALRAAVYAAQALSRGRIY